MACEEKPALHSVTLIITGFVKIQNIREKKHVVYFMTVKVKQKTVAGGLDFVFSILSLHLLRVDFGVWSTVALRVVVKLEWYQGTIFCELGFRSPGSLEDKGTNNLKKWNTQDDHFVIGLV